jgi:hypothetical protein
MDNTIEARHCECHVRLILPYCILAEKGKLDSNIRTFDDICK